jgi:pimeloyl-ACP methyl ester carboxylesterase
MSEWKGVNREMVTSSYRSAPRNMFRYFLVAVLTVLLFNSCIFRETQEASTHIVVGEVADLSHDRFSEKSWQKGLYKPEEFARETGVGIYFLEEYDTGKIPILFINGVNGSPQRWKLFFKAINGDRYQPWFFSYPTGMSLAESAALLTELLEGLRGIYGFENMYLTAHGTGGLIARAAIIKNLKEESPNYITVFVSIATPWGGYKAEAVKLLDSTNAIPSLVDMKPDSQFIRSLYSKRMDLKLDHYMFVAYGTGMRTLGPMGGPPPLKSQLYFTAQTEAVKEFGFYEDYLGILGSEDVVRKYMKILAKKEKARR